MRLLDSLFAKHVILWFYAEQSDSFVEREMLECLCESIKSASHYVPLCRNMWFLHPLYRIVTNFISRL